MSGKHILMQDDMPVATATRWERLSMEMSRYSPAQQKLMHITSVPDLDEVD